MRIDSLDLYQFRSHAYGRFSFDPRITVISGPNGSGKTSILEAIYILARGKSFLDSDTDLVQFGKAWWRVEGSFDRVERDIRYDAASAKPHKEIVIGGSKRGRFTTKYTIPMVLFEPDDLLLIHGSPARRRRYLDALAAQLYPMYGNVLRRYERALLQRNNLLKQGGNIDDTLFVWDVTLSELASQIISWRRQTIENISPHLARIYREISSRDEAAEITYSPAATYKEEGIRQHIMSLLAQRHERDKLTGFTSVGPHRDDITFYLRKREALTTASRGEVRTLILALKLTETVLVESLLAQQPIVLLDDVFSELDEVRRLALVNNLSHDEQIIITTTNSDADSIVKGAHSSIRL